MDALNRWGWPPSRLAEMNAHERAMTIAMMDEIHRAEKKQNREMKQQSRRVH